MQVLTAVVCLQLGGRVHNNLAEGAVEQTLGGREGSDGAVTVSEGTLLDGDASDSQCNARLDEHLCQSTVGEIALAVTTTMIDSTHVGESRQQMEGDEGTRVQGGLGSAQRQQSAVTHTTYREK
ncbi:hypothetical protein EYF80_003950 [Liparis tanakae]|uniref:Uncharacterized protein n=1 Tax=Liparis tanakae TaxID=230148 RepID=A0A4Z2J7V4_9TELE|nr:hypothetical protein EYF80_003950 [Liparis tanakae]